MTLPPKLGVPTHYVHVVWLAARAEEALEYFDELDETRHSIRCVRLHQDGRKEAFSYASANWRDVMPTASIPEVDVINRDTQFRARTISRAEFEKVWDAAQPEDPLRFNIVDSAGQFLCPCCGLAGQFNHAPYGSTGGMIGGGICASCYWEPGFDDDHGASAKAAPSIKASLLAYRAEWVADGYPWRAATKPPPHWDGQKQCTDMLTQHPHLAEAK